MTAATLPRRGGRDIGCFITRDTASPRIGKRMSWGPDVLFSSGLVGTCKVHSAKFRNYAPSDLVFEETSKVREKTPYPLVFLSGCQLGLSLGEMDRGLCLWKRAKHLSITRHLPEYYNFLVGVCPGNQAQPKSHISLQRSSHVNKLRDKGRRFEHLKPNWDSYGAVPPSAIAVKNTQSFLEVLEVLQLTPDWVEPTSDDSIMLEVKVGDVLQEWDFYSDGEVVVLYEKDGEAVECRMVEPKAWEMSRHVTV